MKNILVTDSELFNALVKDIKTKVSNGNIDIMMLLKNGSTLCVNNVESLTEFVSFGFILIDEQKALKSLTIEELEELFAESRAATLSAEELDNYEESLRLHSYADMIAKTIDEKKIYLELLSSICQS